MASATGTGAGRAIAALRGGPFHGERRELANLGEGFEPFDFASLSRWMDVDESDLVKSGFPTVLQCHLESRRMPGYGFKADVMPGGHFMYHLAGRSGRTGLYICEQPGMTPADMHRRHKVGKANRDDRRAALAQGLTIDERDAMAAAGHALPVGAYIDDTLPRPDGLVLVGDRVHPPSGAGEVTIERTYISQRKQTVDGVALMPGDSITLKHTVTLT